MSSRGAPSARMVCLPSRCMPPETAGTSWIMRTMLNMGLLQRCPSPCRPCRCPRPVAARQQGPRPRKQGHLRQSLWEGFEGGGSRGLGFGPWACVDLDTQLLRLLREPAAQLPQGDHVVALTPNGLEAASGSSGPSGPPPTFCRISGAMCRSGPGMGTACFLLGSLRGLLGSLHDSTRRSKL